MKWSYSGIELRASSLAVHGGTAECATNCATATNRRSYLDLNPRVDADRVVETAHQMPPVLWNENDVTTLQRHHVRSDVLRRRRGGGNGGKSSGRGGGGRRGRGGGG